MSGRRARLLRRTGGLLAVALAGALLLEPPGRAGSTAPAPETPAGEPAPSGTVAEAVPRPAQGEAVTLAFLGDVNAEGDAAAALRTGLPGVRDVLGRADLAMVNLETAVTTRGTPAAKQYNFRTSPAIMSRLKDIGVDVATVANNHGMDYGRRGLRDTLSASEATGLPLVGAGVDADAAFAPLRRTVRGQRIAILSATQVLDGSLEAAWTAGPSTPGLASARDPGPLLEAVAQARQTSDTVVVYLHWGQEKSTCPLPVQRELAEQLVAAGADVIVGTHAHVLLGGGTLAGAYVDYGLGNGVFAARSTEARRSGVLTLTLRGRAVTGADWAPARVVSGRPVLLTGDAAEAAVEDKRRRRSCTGLEAPPETTPR